MFRIGDFSKLTQVSVRMLRYYDALGLFKPTEVDLFTGYRYYSARQISRLNQIIALRDMGFLTAEIAAILEEAVDDDKLLWRLAEKKREIENTIACESEKLQRLENLMKSIGMESVSMNYEVTLKNVPSYKVASVREVIPAYDREGLLWKKLGEFADREKITCAGPCFAIYHDREYREADVDVEVVMCVDQLWEDAGGIRFRETEAVPCMAAMMVPGPFENIARACNALAEWVEKNGYEVNGTARQVCHKGPWNESNPENYLTEIQMPVVKR